MQVASSAILHILQRISYDTAKHKSIEIIQGYNGTNGLDGINGTMGA